MLARLASLRIKLLAAMVVAACGGLAGSYVLLSGLKHSDERAADRQKARQTAQAIGSQAAGLERDDFKSIQEILHNDRIVVRRNGRTIYAGPRIDRPLELTVTTPFPGGSVVLSDHESSGATGVSVIEIIVIAGAAIALVIAAALGVATMVIRALRRPIEQATEAARRVAGGDLGARIGDFSEIEFAELGSTFDEMAERLEAADQDQHRFLGDVAHEIATPVNAIRGFAAALADGTMTSPEEQEEALSLIDNQGRRLDSLLDDLRQLTRLDLTETVRSEMIDLAELCDDLAVRFRPEAAASGAEFTLVTAGKQPITFRSDRRLVETVLDNLLSNAIRYTPAGGRIELSAAVGPHDLTLAVRDTGIGIAPEHVARIFDRLYRVDEARDRMSGGSGLGLAIAQRAAREIGGRIELSTVSGAGSEFRLVLPYRPHGRRAKA